MQRASRRGKSENAGGVNSSKVMLTWTLIKMSLETIKIKGKDRLQKQWYSLVDVFLAT